MNFFFLEIIFVEIKFYRKTLIQFHSGGKSFEQFCMSFSESI